MLRKRYSPQVIQNFLYASLDWISQDQISRARTQRREEKTSNRRRDNWGRGVREKQPGKAVLQGWGWLLLVVGWGLLAQSGLAQEAPSSVERMKFETGEAYLVVEILDDDLVHFEAGLGAGPETGTPLYTTPMVAKTDYAGPTVFTDDGAGQLATATLTIAVDTESLCATVTDQTYAPPLTLSTFCPENLDKTRRDLTISAETMTHVYGLGEAFRTPGETDGDWVGDERSQIGLGNNMGGFSGGAVGNAMFPVMVALGEQSQNYALFVDGLNKQTWEFVGDRWTVTTTAEPLRWYVLAGPNLPDLRSDYLELTGRPPVPPKALFGLWVSEYGYDDWAELEEKRQTLDENGFPQDGFVLDLQWFGGIELGHSQMGGLRWDEANFPDPETKIAQLASEEGLGIVVIEESYVDRNLSNYGLMASQGYLVRECDGCGPTTMRAWWGLGGMVDWTNGAGADLWHDMNRQPLIEAGVMGHWTDLGEPEMFAPESWYAGLPGLELHDQVSNHNYYNLAWAQSIWRGYERNGVDQRPVILSRSGTSGIQRYGVAMWSADIGSNFESLAAHMNAQMHMAFSGVDYFGSDIGGFHRGGITGEALDELYTVWFANSSLLDVPVRPHTENLSNAKETAPDRVGDLASNLANIRLRYALSPYLYSLAYEAYLTGAPVVPPLVFYHQADQNTRPLGNHKLLGQNLLVRTVTEPGMTGVDVYLPAGQWVNFYSGAWFDSAGGWLEAVPVQTDGLFRLPLFLRAGAIVPLMAVDEQTMNLYGLRRDGSVRDELIVRVVPSTEATTFTLYEDDGYTMAYQRGVYRTTLLSQQWVDDEVRVTIAAAANDYPSAVSQRNNILQLDWPGQPVAGVMLGDEPLAQMATKEAWDAAATGYFLDTTTLWVKSGVLPVTEEKQFLIQLAQTNDEPSATPEPVIASTPVEADAPTPTEATPSTGLIVLGVVQVVLVAVIGWWLWRRKD
ncbi:MAG: DUF5110 domain-containing protein [Chloroflexi bacterium]|nr:DUF5110 domain-containing protein [Chloroflexota bacterium]